MYQQDSPIPPLSSNPMAAVCVYVCFYNNFYYIISIIIYLSKHNVEVYITFKFGDYFKAVQLDIIFYFYYYCIFVLLFLYFYYTVLFIS